MTVRAYSRGHETYYDGTVWRFTDNNEIDDDNRPCFKCKLPPTKEGYDPCLGYIEGVTSACCGHGVEEGYVVKEDDEFLKEHQFHQVIFSKE